MPEFPRRFVPRVPGPAWAWASAIAVLGFQPLSLAAQGGTSGTVRVFLDCQGVFCDQEYVLQEIHWIDWVRDRLDADVQILATTQPNGGGGEAWELAFLGLRDFEGLDDTLTFGTAGDATRDEVREELVRYLGLGLARYVARTPTGAEAQVQVPRPEPGSGGARGTGQGQDAADDPWNFWVFRVGVNGNVSGETSFRSQSFTGTARASRTTDLWKLSISGRHSQRSSEFDLGDGETVVAEVDSWNTDGLLVRSLGPHWGIGGKTRVGADTFVNQDFFWRLEPGLEYNFFPYDESSRRLLTLQYTLPLNGWDYTEETIYGETSEVRLQHALTANLSLRQPWGQTEFTLSGSQYLHDPDFYNVNLFGSANVRLFRGFSFRVFGSYAWVRDQLFLPAGDLSDEDILTRRQALATGFEYFVSFGITYQFGSIFNNIVNPRFGGGEGRFFF